MGFLFDGLHDMYQYLFFFFHCIPTIFATQMYEIIQSNVLLDAYPGYIHGNEI